MCKLYPISSYTKGTFGYNCFTDRLPRILTTVIDTLNKSIHNCTNSLDCDDKKLILERVVKLKYSLYTCKSIPLPLIDNFENKIYFNSYISNLTSCNPNSNEFTWLNIPWLPAECFLYRKLFECFYLSDLNKDMDYFADQKYQMYDDAKESIINLVKYTKCIGDKLKEDENLGEEEKRNYLHQLIQMTLWGNKSDMSLSSGNAIEENKIVGGLNELKSLSEKYLLANNMNEAAKYIMGGLEKVVYVLDNCGMELASDLCLIYYMLKSGYAKNIQIHMKKIPWFVSDVMISDFNKLLEELKIVDGFVEEIKEYINEGRIKLYDDIFWVGPGNYYEMEKVAPELHLKLQSTSLIIFKGDLNYRKLVGDLKWSPKTEFKTALRNFSPCPILAIRTLKSETFPGIEKSQDEMDKLPKDWYNCGDYGVIHFAF